MNDKTSIIDEIKKYKRICYYPACGADLSDIDYFCSGKRPLEERKTNDNSFEGDYSDLPDLYIHSDVNFYYQFEADTDLDLSECNMHTASSVVEFKELAQIAMPNSIYDNPDYSGRCFEYKLSVKALPKPITLIFCLCENEYVVSRLFMQNSININCVWAKNYNGGKAVGTWLANVFHLLNTKKMYTDWLCVPGFRGQPANKLVKEHYPELMQPAKVKLVRNSGSHWIDESAHGWVEEFDIQRL